MKAELYKDADNRWRWRILARNGKVLADSGQSYSRRIDCHRGLWIVALGRVEKVIIK